MPVDESNFTNSKDDVEQVDFNFHKDCGETIHSYQVMRNNQQMKSEMFTGKLSFFNMVEKSREDDEQRGQMAPNQ